MADLRTDLVEKGDVNFLTNIDFSQIDEMDPNVFNGHKAIFDSDIEFDVRILEDNGKYRNSESRYRYHRWRKRTWKRGFQDQGFSLGKFYNR